MSHKQGGDVRTGMSRVLVAVTAAGAAVIHGAAGATAADGGVGTVLVMAGAAELTIAVGAAIGARWLPAARTIALLLVIPVLLWATSLLIAVTADSPAIASELATVPLAGASLMGLAGAAFAGADARRTRVGARVRPARAGIAIATAVMLTALVVTPSVAATLPAPIVAPEEEAATTIVFGDHTGHEGYTD